MYHDRSADDWCQTSRIIRYCKRYETYYHPPEFSAGYLLSSLSFPDRLTSAGQIGQFVFISVSSPATKLTCRELRDLFSKSIRFGRLGPTRALHNHVGIEDCDAPVVKFSKRIHDNSKAIPERLYAV